MAECTFHAHLNPDHSSQSSCLIHILFLFTPRCKRPQVLLTHTSPDMKELTAGNAAMVSCLYCFLTLTSQTTGIQVALPEPSSSQSPATNSSTLLLPTSTESTDNGVAVGEAPDVTPTGSGLDPQLSKDTDSLLNGLARSTPFPENHKNATEDGSSLEVPPYLLEYNKYQQQYKEYLAQKNLYAATAKPVKFDDLPKNRFLTDGISAYGDDAATQPEASTTVDTFPRNKPFPFFFPQEDANLDIPEPTAYPIPDNNLLTGPSAEENLDKPSFLPSFLEAPFANLFGSQLAKKQKHEEAHGHRTEVLPKKKIQPVWKKIVKVVSTVLPLGLFLATLTPNLIYINSTAEDSKPSRIRSQEGTDLRQSRSDEIVDPLVAMVQRFGGLEAMEDPQCEDRFFCEMSILGDKPDSNFVEKGFWYLANETPEHAAEEVGMKELFNAIKNKSCDIYKCAEKKLEAKSSNESVPDSANRIETDVKETKKIRKVKKFIRSR